jgi:hypothetical protein
MEIAPLFILCLGLVVCIGAVMAGERLGSQRAQLAMLGVGGTLVALGVYLA